MQHFSLYSPTGGGKATQNQSTRGIQCKQPLFSPTFCPLSPPTFCFISNTSNWSNWELRNPLIYDQASNLQLGQSPTLTTVPGLGLNPGSEGKARALPPTWSRRGERSLQAVMMDAKSQHSQARVGEPTAGCSFRGTPVHLKRAIQLMFYFGRLLNCFCQGDLPHCFITW